MEGPSAPSPAPRSSPTKVAYDSAPVGASPSYTMYDPSIYPSLLDIPAALGRDWFVNVPDYEDPLAAVIEGVQYGHAILDSVRAVLEFTKMEHDLCLRPDAKYALWGFSGGGIASEWGAELQESYAPDLNFAGVVVGGAVPRAETSIGLITGHSLRD